MATYFYLKRRQNDENILTKQDMNHICATTPENVCYFFCFLALSFLCNCELTGNEQIVQPRWFEYILENMEKCLDKLKPHHASHIHNIKDVFTFIFKCNSKMTTLMCKLVILADKSRVKTYNPCGYINVGVTELSSQKLSEIKVFEFRVQVPEMFSVNGTVLHLGMLALHHGLNCRAERMIFWSVDNAHTEKDQTNPLIYSEGIEKTVDRLLCGPSDSIHSYISMFPTFMMRAIFYPKRQTRSVKIVYQVVSSRVVKMFQLRSRLYHLEQPFAYIDTTDYLLSQELLQRHYVHTMYRHTYSLMVLAESGYRIQAKMSVINATISLGYLKVYDGPSKQYPVIYSLESLDSRRNDKLTKIDVLTRGPRMFIELSVFSQVVSNLTFSHSITVTSVLIQSTKSFNISNNKTHFHLLCPSYLGLTQCIWTFTANPPSKWLNISLHSLDLSLLESFACSKGKFAVYDKDHTIQNQGKIYDTCSNLPNHVQRSAVSRHNQLVVILVLYDQMVRQGVWLEASIAPSFCQGYFSSLNFKKHHPEWPFMDEETYTVIAVYSRITLYWDEGCAIVQNRGSWYIGVREIVFKVEAILSRLKLVYFQSALAATCKQTILLIAGEYPEPLYPQEPELNTDMNFIRDIVTNDLTVIVGTAPAYCPYYEAAFDIWLQSYCDNLGSLLMQRHLHLKTFDQFYQAYPEVGPDSNCGQVSFSIKSQEAGVVISHCEAFTIQQINRTLIFRLDFHFHCESYGSDFCTRKKYAQTSTVYIQNKCALDRIVGCSATLTGSVNKTCSPICFRQIQFAIREITEGSHMFLVSPSFTSDHAGTFSIHVRVIKSTSFLIVLYPVYDIRCQCEISFQSSLNPFHWYSKGHLEPYLLSSETTHTKYEDPFLYRDNAYIFSYSANYSWHQAQAECVSFDGGHLWTIIDEDELNVVLDKYLQAAVTRDKVAHNKVIYIGLKSHKVE